MGPKASRGPRADAGEGERGDSAGEPGAGDGTDDPSAAPGPPTNRQIVQFLHLASPYIVGHRSKTFVLVLPGELMADEDALAPVLDDVLLLHGLGVRCVLVAGSSARIDAALREQGRDPGLVGAYRVTDGRALRAALEASARNHAVVAARASRAPAVALVRRHATGDSLPGFGAGAARDGPVCDSCGSAWGWDGGDSPAAAYAYGGEPGRAGGEAGGGAEGAAQAPAGSWSGSGTGDVPRPVEYPERLGPDEDGPGADPLRGGVGPRGAAQRETSPAPPQPPQANKPTGQPVVQVVNGNFTLARRRGIVEGVDFGAMGVVRRVHADAIRAQLDADAVVLLTNIGVTAAGELLNCNVFDVATHAAVELRAEKLLVLTSDDVQALRLPAYLPLADAERRIAEAAGAPGRAPGRAEAPRAAAGEARGRELGPPSYSDRARPSPEGVEALPLPRFPPTATPARTSGELLLDLDAWKALGVPPAVLSAVLACRAGVPRAHLVDGAAAARGALLLELYSRDGVAGVCMIAADLYQGMRRARTSDGRGVARLLAHVDEGGGLDETAAERAAAGAGGPPSAAEGSPPASAPPAVPAAPRFRSDRLTDRLSDVTVLEREGRVLGAAAVSNVGPARDGARCAELSLLVVDPRYRNAGLGDALLDYVEQDARFVGYRRLAAVQLGSGGFFDWLVNRRFVNAPRGHLDGTLPRGWVASLPDVAQVYVKELEGPANSAPAGSRIGF